MVVRRLHDDNVIVVAAGRTVRGMFNLRPLAEISGGEIVAQATPEKKAKGSFTGKYLAPMLTRGEKTGGAALEQTLETDFRSPGLFSRVVVLVELSVALKQTSGLSSHQRCSRCAPSGICAAL